MSKEDIMSSRYFVLLNISPLENISFLGTNNFCLIYICKTFEPKMMIFVSLLCKIDNLLLIVNKTSFILDRNSGQGIF